MIITRQVLFFVSIYGMFSMTDFVSLTAFAFDLYSIVYLSHFH